MRVIIAGGRDFANHEPKNTTPEALDEVRKLNIRDYRFAETKIHEALAGYDYFTIEIISGQAKGADYVGEVFAGQHDITLKKFPADWSLYGRSAGVIRNERMAEHAAPGGMLIAFWDGKSKGTKNMIDNAERYGLKVKVIYY